MNTPRILLIACLLQCAHLSPLQAGYSIPELGIQAVTLGGESADKDALDFARANNLPYPPIDAPVSPADMALLKTIPGFSELPSDAARQSKIVGIRIMVLTAIESLKHQDPAIAECLERLYRKGIICVASAPGRPVSASIANDNSTECGSEPLNIYTFPPGEVPLYDPSFFKLANSLAHEALHAVQSHLAPTNTGSLDDRARYLLKRQSNEADASSAELQRCNALIAVLESLINNDRLPPQASGLAARIGASLLNDPKLSPAQRRNNAQSLLASIRETCEDAKVTLECRQAYKRALELFLQNGTATNRTATYNAAIQETTWYRETTIRNLPEFGSFQITYRAGGGRFEDGPSGPTSIFKPNAEFAQFSSRGLSESFPLPVRAISDVLRFPAEDRILLAGTDTTGKGVILGMEDKNDDGFFDRSSLKELLKDVQLGGGLRWVYEPTDRTLLGVNRRTDHIFQFTLLMETIFPERFTFTGSLDPRGDLMEFWTRNNILYGSTDLGSPLSFVDIYATAQRTTDGGPYVPTLPFQPRQHAHYRPSFDQLPFENARFLDLRGMPESRVEVFSKSPNQPPTSLGTGRLDWSGNLSLKLLQPLKFNATVYIEDRSAQLSSVQEPVVTPPTSTQLEIQKIDDNFSKIGVSYDSYPFKKIDLSYSEDLIDWEPLGSLDLGGYGSKSVTTDKPDPVAGFFRTMDLAPNPLAAQSDQYSSGPGLTLTANVLSNDTAPPGTRAILDELPSVDASLFQWSGDGSFTLTAPVTGPSVIRFKYHLENDFGHRSDPVLVQVFLTFTSLTTLVEQSGADGKGHFNVPCLFLPTRSPLGSRILLRPFPIYQFRLANNPADVCTQPHWHAHAPVHALPSLQEILSGLNFSPLTDPNPGSCGYGRYIEVQRGLVSVPVGYWQTFIQLHPPQP